MCPHGKCFKRTETVESLLRVNAGECSQWCVNLAIATCYSDSAASQQKWLDEVTESLLQHQWLCWCFIRKQKIRKVLAKVNWELTVGFWKKSYTDVQQFCNFTRLSQVQVEMVVKLIGTMIFKWHTDEGTHFAELFAKYFRIHHINFSTHLWNYQEFLFKNSCILLFRDPTRWCSLHIGVSAEISFLASISKCFALESSCQTMNHGCIAESFSL